MAIVHMPAAQRKGEMLLWAMKPKAARMRLDAAELSSSFLLRINPLKASYRASAWIHSSSPFKRAMPHATQGKRAAPDAIQAAQASMSMKRGLSMGGL